MKKIFVIWMLILFSLPAFSKPGTIVTYTIDPEKNAWEHNNMGIYYMEEKCYYAAIQEFKIAISLNPKAQSTSIYLNNLGKVYMIIGYPELALGCFEDALKQYSLNFDFYENLAILCLVKLRNNFQNTVLKLIKTLWQKLWLVYYRNKQVIKNRQ